MKVLTLGAEEVTRACPMRPCIEEMARAFALGSGVDSPRRTRLASPSGDILVMPSLAKRRSRAEASVKVVSIFPHNTGRTPSVNALLLLIDGDNGETRAVMDGGALTAIRTGAVTGLSCRYLARRDSRRLGIIGAGGQAFSQVEGVVCELGGVKEVRIYSRHRERSKALAARCSRELGLTALTETEAEGCVRGSDVLVTATTSETPVFDGSHVRPGTHVVAIGSYRPGSRELDTYLVSRSTIFVDSVEAAMEEAGDIIIPIKEGAISKEAVSGELSDLVSGRRRGRTSDREVTVFKSVGLAMEDNAAGWLAFRRAARAGLGTRSGL